MLIVNETKTVSAVGHVRIGPSGYCLEIGQNYIPALEGLDEFSHIMVLWWSHLADSDNDRAMIQVEKPYRHGPDRLGIFATRSQSRPNPIALSVTPLIRVDVMDGLIEVPWIDAEDGTPIIDIKPYHPSLDRIREVAPPAWCAHWPKWYEDSAEFDWPGEFINAN